LVFVRGVVVLLRVFELLLCRCEELFRKIFCEERLRVERCIFWFARRTLLFVARRVRRVLILWGFLTRCETLLPRRRWLVARRVFVVRRAFVERWVFADRTFRLVFRVFR